MGRKESVWKEGVEGRKVEGEIEPDHSLFLSFLDLSNEPPSRFRESLPTSPLHVSHLEVSPTFLRSRTPQVLWSIVHRRSLERPSSSSTVGSERLTKLSV